MDIPAGIILSINSYKLNEDESLFLKKTNPLGIVLFKRNFKNKSQLTQLVKDLKDATLNPNLLIFIDQEGGRVQRLRNQEFCKFPPQCVFGKFYNQNKKNALNLSYLSSYLMGFELKEVGIDVNFSPVCDLLFDNANKIIGDRSFSSNPQVT